MAKEIKDKTGGQDAQPSPGNGEDQPLVTPTEAETLPEPPQAAPFKGGAFEVSLPASAPMKLYLFGSIGIVPGGPGKVIHLPAGEEGEHQLKDLKAHFTVTPAQPVLVTPDPRMAAAK